MQLGNNTRIAKYLICFQTILILVQDFLIYTLGLPSVFNYTNDIITVLLFLCTYRLIFQNFKQRPYRMILYAIFIYFGICVVGLLTHAPNPILILYGFRQTYRFYILFFVAVAVLKLSDLKKMMRVVVHMQLLNVILVLFEYYVLGCKGDYLGGMFGTVLSCNVPLNIYLCIITTYVVTMYLFKQSNSLELLWICSSSMLVAGLSELKFFYVEFILLVVAAMILARASLKQNIEVVVVACFSLFFGLGVLRILFPMHFDILTNASNSLGYLNKTNYEGAYTVSRIQFISQINEGFFKNNPLDFLFGYGLGQCEESSVSFLNSPFFRQYGDAFNYTWFSSSMRFLETGLLGLISYTFFYLTIAYQHLKTLKKNRNPYSIVSIGVALFAVLNIFYNNTSIKYINYIVILFMSVGYIYLKQLKDEEQMIANQPKKSIPHVIHYCWFGKGPLDDLAKKCIASWEKQMPDYQIQLWNEDNFDININPYVKEAYEAKKYAFVSDYVRLKVLYEHGGVYFDTDVEVVKDLTPILDGGYFALDELGNVSTGLGFACEKGNPMVGAMLKDYEDIHFINENKMDLTSCPIRNTEVLKKQYDYHLTSEMTLVGNMLVYPCSYFNPYHYEKGMLQITPTTYTIHHYGSTWHGKREEKITKIKQWLNRHLGMFFGRAVFHGLYITNILEWMVR